MKWFGYVKRRWEGNCERWTIDMEVDGREKRGRLMTRWRDCVVVDSREMNLDLVMEEERIRWRRFCSKQQPHTETE